MGRVSQAQAAENRERIVATAARLFRERGISGVSVADVTAESGLTHGGFYKHFTSKDALVAEAVARAFAEQAESLRTAADPRVRALIDTYLSPAHRDDPGSGCPTAGFGGDVAHAGGGDGTRLAYAAGVEGFARYLAGGQKPAPPGPQKPDPADGQEPDRTDGQEQERELDLATLCTMVGALILARATSGTPLSDRILAAARESLAAPKDSQAPKDSPAPEDS
ncbi:TetR/AcrR family transcriptional regulator [Actinoplanes sp. CA-252034]|uniref:TetR/AcrR family transcriptional regulator n=1 Tax=Actinoplanes sp. CA-252034 TaxID=3239906 RepID=UPI003D997A27